jgi:hypothetical protein
MINRWKLWTFLLAYANIDCQYRNVETSINNIIIFWIWLEFMTCLSYGVK